MENLILAQMYSFFIYLISGIIIAIFFDIFRILRRTFHTTDLLTYIEDIFFWIITGVFLLIVLFKFGNGAIRIYNIIGMTIGIILYMFFISKSFININVFILGFIKRILCKFFNILLYPLKYIFKLLRKIFSPFTFFVINTQKVILNFKNYMKKKVKLKNKMKK